VRQLIEDFSMEEFRKMSSLDLSIGQRRRLQVAREFVHDMDLLFLDEPTVGLDPLVRRHALNYFKQKVRDGLSIFFTTHILEEAEYLCNRIAVINHGRIVAVDTPANLKRRFGTAKEVEFGSSRAPPRTSSGSSPPTTRWSPSRSTRTAGPTRQGRRNPSW
jgi:ABC-2 type transport system ATP-binding protein